MHELFEHRCGIFWHMKTHDYCSWRRISLWRKRLGRLKELDAIFTAD